MGEGVLSFGKDEDRVYSQNIVNNVMDGIKFCVIVVLLIDLFDY